MPSPRQEAAPTGLTVSRAVGRLLTEAAEGRLSLHPTHDEPASDPGDLDNEFLELEAKGGPHHFTVPRGAPASCPSRTHTLSPKAGGRRPHTAP